MPHFHFVVPARLNSGARYYFLRLFSLQDSTVVRVPGRHSDDARKFHDVIFNMTQLPSTTKEEEEEEKNINNNNTIHVHNGGYQRDGIFQQRRSKSGFVVTQEGKMT